MSAPIHKLDGPRLMPASGAAARQLIILLHGYGADGNDLIALGQHWRNQLRDAAFVAPHAPEPCAGNPFGGRQWFELTFRDPAERWRGVCHAAPALNAFLDDELARFGLADDALALVGFSQGTMMALHVGLRRARQIAGIVGFSGLIAGSEHLAADIASRPPVLLVHGDSDDVIPVEALGQARGVLGGLNVPLQWHVSAGLTHGIDNEGLDLAGSFLRGVFRGGGRGGGE
jgi:phospholipase/carboxylesterase